jgi:cyclophilin family peptidyl-prolyl cis-trans isomerase
MKRLLGIAAAALCALTAGAQTIATFNTSVGVFDVELFDDKPITVSNFLKYASSGRFEDQIIHRWVPGFVIQGGGYRVDKSDPEQWVIKDVATFGTITNEAQVGTFRSNSYGTIAMARSGSVTNSATSQWYINLKDNGGPPPGGSDLDTLHGGYTVFGRVISNTNVINKFFPEPPANGIHIRYDIIPFSPLAVLSTNELTWDDLVYVNITFRRDMELRVTQNVRGVQQIAWSSVAGVTNAVDYSTTLTNWTTLTNMIGTGTAMQVPALAGEPERFYRVRLLY